LRTIGEVIFNLTFKLARQQQTRFAFPFERALRGNRLVARFQAFAISFAVNRPSQLIDCSPLKTPRDFVFMPRRVCENMCHTPHFVGSNQYEETPLTEETEIDLLRVSIISLTSFRRPFNQRDSFSAALGDALVNLQLRHENSSSFPRLRPRRPRSAGPRCA
jgi:hypothetical protein